MPIIEIPIPDKPAWSGPYVGGITQSLITRFLECPLRFYLYAICGLQDPRPAEENLVWGDLMHKALEIVIKGYTKEQAMEAVEIKIIREYPSSPEIYMHTIRQMLEMYDFTFVEPGDIAEHEFAETWINGVLCRGKVDHMRKGQIITDHKCKGRIYPIETQNEITHDFQMNFYDLFNPAPNWRYDLIKIPVADYWFPPQQGSESSEGWAHRVFNTHSNYDKGYPISKNPGQWVCQFPWYQDRDVHTNYVSKTIKPIVERVIRWWDHVNQPGFDPNNPDFYNDIFYETPTRLFDPTRTEKFQTHYHGLFTGDYEIGFLTKVDRFYAELDVEQVG